MGKLLNDTICVTRKEFRGFFATPAAYLFLGVFLAVNLFVFFWVETFFARNIADVRPLFQWMPLLLIFLVAALTMRSWSEERRAGTLESLLTAPVAPLALVLGKFAAVLGLVAGALLLTLPLPVTVSSLGPLDWGPVVGGYLATLFLASAYIAIGTCMSSRTENPIVALILTVVVCSLFYLVGSGTLTNLFGHQISGLLALLGTGTRFESITRGVLDLRDLYYYLAIVGVFLTLNLYSLERLRWDGNPLNPRHRRWGWVAGLAAVNFIAANLWLAPIGWARADITQGNLYSLSEATQQQLDQLREPLLIRGYFSAKTHPLLAPLIPQIMDLLKEYSVAAGGRAQIEFVDPTLDQAAEEEAASRYGIRSMPFQTADRYQSAVVNSYFDLVISYGDQYETLGFQDLIEVKSRGARDLDVLLKNPEYAITRAIRKVSGAYQAGGNPFENLTTPVTFKGYLSPDNRLPESLRSLRANLEKLLDKFGEQAGNKLQISFEDPDAQGGELAAKLKQKYGFGPQVVSLLDPKPFWFYMVLESDGEALQVPLPETLDEAALERSLDAAFQRLTPGVLKTIALVEPQSENRGNQRVNQRYSQLEEVIGENNRIKETDLKNGYVPEDADLLLVLAPRELDEKQRFAIDQFLMQGGSVVLATSPFDVQVSRSIEASKQDSGLTQWLASYGIEIDESMVLDLQNAALPVPVQRNVGGLTLQEIRMLPYPHFPDLRGEGMNDNNPITAFLGEITLNWASPIRVDLAMNKERIVTELLRSSDLSWTSDSLNVVPDYGTFPETGFTAGGERKSQLLSIAVEGRFNSFYQDKPSPLIAAENSDGDKPESDAENEGKKTAERVSSVIGRSPESARLILVSSNSFASDIVIDLTSQSLNTRYTKSLDFLQNAIDWSLEDGGLLALRGRTQLARTLNPLSEGGQRFWEAINYILALAGLFGVWGWRRWVNKSHHNFYAQILAEV